MSASRKIQGVQKDSSGGTVSVIRFQVLSGVLWMLGGAIGFVRCQRSCKVVYVLFAVRIFFFFKVAESVLRYQECCGELYSARNVGECRSDLWYVGCCCFVSGAIQSAGGAQTFQGFLELL